MSDKPLFDERGAPPQDPVDDFMRQLSRSAAKHRRSISVGGALARPVFANKAFPETNEGVGAVEADNLEGPAAPVIDNVAVGECNDLPGCWAVEALDTEGSFFQVLFQGPDAESRAREYARWKYGGEA